MIRDGDEARLRVAVATALAAHGIDDGAFSFAADAGWCEFAVGDWVLDRPAPLMSSSKWMSAMTMMTLVDGGLVQLDDPVCAYIPEFAHHDPAKRTITVRQCLSLTSGLRPRHRSIMDPSLTLRDSVACIAAEPLLAEPGTAIVYGGNGFQVAGLVAETVTGESWNAIFEQRISRPLGLRRTSFGDGRSRNPWLAGGARSTVSDFRVFLGLQLSGGLHRRTRIVSAESLAEMSRDQTVGARVLQSPFDDGRRYGLGVWLDALDGCGAVTRIGSHGGAGSIPWCNRCDRYTAHLFVHKPDHTAFRGFRDALAISEALDPLLQQMAAGATAAQDEGSPPLSPAGAGVEDQRRG